MLLAIDIHLLILHQPKRASSIYIALNIVVLHSDMLAKVHVVSEIEYAKWESGESADVEMYADMAPDKIGEQLYTSKGCVACHSIDGANGVGPTWKALFGKENLQMEVVLQMKIILKFQFYTVKPPQGKVVKGYAQLYIISGSLSDSGLQQ